MGVSAKTVELCAEATKDDPFFWGYHDERILALIEAARIGEINTVRELVKSVPDPNIPNRMGYTALAYALAKGNNEMEKVLASHGAVPHAEDGNALWLAVLDQNVAVVRSLISRFPYMVTATKTDVGPSGVARTWQPAIRYALLRGDTEVIRLLLEHGADPNTLDGFPLWNEVVEGRTKNVKLLVQAGAKITPRALEPATGEIREYLESQLNAATNGASSSGARTEAGQ